MRVSSPRHAAGVHGSSRSPRAARRTFAAFGLSIVVAGTLVVNPGAASATTPVSWSDDFNRSSGSSWGVAADGNKYSHPFGAGRTSVRSGAGVMSLSPGTAAEGTLKSLKALDTSVDVEVEVGSLPKRGNGTYVGPMVRVSGDRGYRLSARIMPRGKVDLYIERVAGRPERVKALARKRSALSIKADRTMNLRLTATGTSVVSLRATAWADGRGGRKATVSVSDRSAARIDDPGAVALWGYHSKRSGSNRIAFDNLRVSGTLPTGAVQPAPAGPSSPPSPDIPDPSTPAPEEPTTPIDTSDAGALPIGEASYPVPAKAIVVSPSGSDSAAGSLSSPVRTISRAVTLATSGSTIVLREGTYHESVMVPKNKTLSIQSYPQEAVWLDGSSPVSGFVKSGSTWVKNDWNVQFDSSPTHARGAADSTTPGWQWIDPAYPMASHPDQVWIDGSAQKQVGSLDAVTAGTFFVDYAAKKMYLGSDPTDKAVRASDLVLGLTLLSPNSALRGFGIRRFAPSVPDLGAVRLFDADGSTLENIAVTDNATLGLSIGSAKVRMNKVTSARNGLMGIGSNYADDLDATRLRVEDNNLEHFNAAPSAGGYKFSRSRHVSISDSVFSNNFAAGLWFDESSYDVKLVGNDMGNNAAEGLVFELSAKLTAVNNAMWGNAMSGLLVLDSNDVRFWNNSIRGGLLPVRISDGPRVASDVNAAGHDKRQPLPDPQVTWVTKNVEFKNNVVGDAKQGANGSNWCGIVCVTDDRKQATAAEMNAQLDGNLYYRASATALPQYVIRWAGGTKGTVNFKTLADFKRTVAQEAQGAEVTGTSYVVASGALASGTSLSNVGVPIPADIAAIGGLSAGDRRVGPQR
ncbi:MAG: right-handed parallel beta-helix repeat-containing protein [Aeromicrobium sp.]